MLILPAAAVNPDTEMWVGLPCFSVSAVWRRRRCGGDASLPEGPRGRALLLLPMLLEIKEMTSVGELTHRELREK